MSIRTAISILIGCLSATLSIAGDPMPPAEGLVDAFPAQADFSPYAGRRFPTKALWGDTHLDTSNSLDARAFGVTLDPEQAFRFARGEEVTTSHGLRVKLSRPLDWLVVSDHSDGIPDSGSIWAFPIGISEFGNNN